MSRPVWLRVDAGALQEHCASAAAQLRAGQPILWNRRVIVQPQGHDLECQLLDPAPGAHRCEEEFKVLIENAARELSQSVLWQELPQRRLRWTIVEDRDGAVVQVWP